MKSLLQYIILSVLLLCLPATGFNPVFATHNRAGEITLRQVKDLTYEITITTYTYVLSAADRPELEVQWGDNSTSIAPRILAFNLPNDYRKNVYVKQHTFPGPGTYVIVVQDPNRNYGVKNIPNSVNVIFSIKTTISINPQIGQNSTPVLLNPPFDKAGLNQIFIHNPAAFDPDGDSISYSLTVCTQQNGEPIPGYTLPKASDTLYVDAITGDLVWNTPVDTGIYNIAMNIEEWRKNIKIGNIVRDMQVEVYKTTNLPPVNDSLPKLCVVAGTKISYDIRSTDANFDPLKHFLTGGPFVVKDSPADTMFVSSVPGEIITRFIWQTTCEHVRKQPYSVLVKTNDLNPKLSLVDIDNLEINVLGPPPQNVKLVPASNLIRVQWKAGECDNIRHYNIYRRTSSSGYMPDSCSYGLPAYAGFKLAGSTSAGTDSIFIDDGNGKGLLQGTEYCYRVVAVYPDGSESIPSDESCTILTPGSPSILNTSVTKSDAVNGEIFLSWAKPLKLDTIPANGPYEYIIYRADNLFGMNLSEVHRFTTSDLNDTVYTDTNINTLRFPYTYSVELYNDAPGNRFLIGKPEIASTMYPEVSEMDNAIGLKFVRNVPWLNYENTVYRFNKNSGVFDSIYVTDADTYTNSGLVNGNEYCYQIKSKATRSLNGITYFMENVSHVGCGTPMDTIPPCPPTLQVSSICDSTYNFLSWSISDSACADDVVRYNIYYTPQLNLPHTLIDSTELTTYIHRPASSLAACYYVTAIDSFGNESKPSTNMCVDECFNYEIPNVFTPNGDGVNDFLHPFPYQFVEKIDMKIFNRWGQLIFQTDDPDINWDGKISNSNKMASPGVYYYICDVFEKRLTGTEVRNIVGFIHLYTDVNAKNSEK
ncbi:MAG: gliding motility-associated C-terminal domain-containing protein [Bacteroidales bacterium]|nr:gliding motility-associated C-terminal domain-containing protein [Bacteroidales bacterium]MCB9000011.1 gliding motility-associated C-terminal domain-containing protein [Bacteroidales bacterium]MCB9013259.1 gliding motility-associated C-terminal domain-containing protein [Bacteroidales bacterium]